MSQYPTLQGPFYMYKDKFCEIKDVKWTKSATLFGWGAMARNAYTLVYKDFW